MKVYSKRMQIIKYIGTIICVFVLGFALQNVSVAKADTLEGELQLSDDGKYEYKSEFGNTCCIVKYIGLDREVVVPSSINNLKVTHIGWGAFSNSGVTSIQLPYGINTIDSSAFNSCYRLETINIPSTVKKIGEHALTNTLWLQNKQKVNPLVSENGIVIDGSNCTGDVVIPSGITSICASSFKENKNITSVTTPDSVKVIGEWAFYQCTKLKSVKIACNVKRIEEYTFGNCSALEQVNVVSPLDSVGEYAFGGTKWIEDKRKTNQPIILNGALIDMNSLETQITVPLGVTSISTRAFWKCKDVVTKITLPSGLKKIGEEAFRDYYKLQTINIPDSVTEIGNAAFLDCHSLKSIDIPSKVSCIDDYTFGDCIALTNIIIPQNVTSIGIKAFSHCKKLTDITIPSTVKSFGWGAFADTNLADNYYTTVGKNKFLIVNCVLLRAKCNERNVVVPSGVTTIAGGAFYATDDYTDADVFDVTLPNSVVEISEHAFYYEDYNYFTQLNSIIIPSSVKKIGESAFKGTGLKSITIPDSVVSLGSVAFSDCDKLECAKIGTGIKIIDSHTFGNCDNLTNVVLQPGVRRLNYYSFGGCVKLAYLAIPETVSSFESEVLRDDSKTTIGFLGNQNQLDNLLKSIDEQYIKDSIKCIAADYDSSGNVWNKDTQYVWSADNSSCTASRTCFNDPTLFLKETVSSTNVVSKNPSITSEGVRTYTATFKNSLFAIQTKLVPIAKTMPKQIISVSKPAKVSLLKVKNIKKRKISVSFKKIKKVKGYQISYSLTKKFMSKKTKNVFTTKTSYKIKGLKKKKTYYIRVRAYKMNGKKKVYGKWSIVKKVKIRK